MRLIEVVNITSAPTTSWLWPTITSDSRRPHLRLRIHSYNYRYRNENSHLTPSPLPLQRQPFLISFRPVVLIPWE